MKDAQTAFSKALPNASANNNTSTLDLSPETVGFLTNQWRQGYMSVVVPAMANHTNTSATIKLTLQQSSVDNTSNFATVDPLIEIQIAGVASTGSAARTVKVPFNPGGKRYYRWLQQASANAVSDNLTVTYDLVTGT